MFDYEAIITPNGDNSQGLFSSFCCNGDKYDRIHNWKDRRDDRMDGRAALAAGLRRLMEEEGLSYEQLGERLGMNHRR